MLTDVTETCQGVRDADYQNYVDEQESNGETAKDYFAWIKSQEEADAELKASSDQYISTAKEIAPFLRWRDSLQ